MTYLDEFPNSLDFTSIPLQLKWFCWNTSQMSVFLLKNPAMTHHLRVKSIVFPVLWNATSVISSPSSPSLPSSLRPCSWKTPSIIQPQGLCDCSSLWNALPPAICKLPSCDQISTQNKAFPETWCKTTTPPLTQTKTAISSIFFMYSLIFSTVLTPDTLYTCSSFICLFPLENKLLEGQVLCFVHTVFLEPRKMHDTQCSVNIYWMSPFNETPDSLNKIREADQYSVTQQDSQKNAHKWKEQVSEPMPLEKRWERVEIYVRIWEIREDIYHAS